MNQARIGIVVSAALVLAPAVAFAQAAPAQPKEIDADAPPGADAPPAEPAAEEPTGEPGEETSGLATLCKIDPEACPNIDFDKAAARDLKRTVYAVQQIYALRARRFELNPYWGFTMNDQFVAHPGPGAAINYYLINPLAIGANFNFYHGLNVNSDFNFQTSRAARVGEPQTEYSWNANFNVSFVPVYGKFAGFSDFIFHYDFYMVAGGGAISTRPIAIIDPDNRVFDYTIKPTGNAGLGLRIFFNRWFSAMLEVRDYIFVDQLENASIAPGDDKKNPETWLGDKSLTNNVQAQVGVSIFLPMSWEYRLPK